MKFPEFFFLHNSKPPPFRLNRQQASTKHVSLSNTMLNESGQPRCSPHNLGVDVTLQTEKISTKFLMQISYAVNLAERQSDLAPHNCFNRIRTSHLLRTRHYSLCLFL
ncbi:MAG: hypothetical protein MI923_03075 [Phycisphaerales bacterium]|nr:hypothetical protein [Phycisphaerales bacterium]